MASTRDDGPQAKRVKTEPEPQDEETVKGTFGEALNDDVESKRRYLIKANQELRKGILEFQERQEQLLEFFEVEFGTEAINKHSKNKERLMYVLGFTEADIAGGRGNPNFAKLFRLLRLTNDFWKRRKSEMHRPSNREARLRFEKSVPQELAELGCHVDFDTGLIGRKPKKRCHRCYDESHEMKFCPHKNIANRSPQVTAMIKARFEKVRAEEAGDPTLSQAYKKTHFKIDLKKDKWKKKREDRRQKL